MKRVRLYKNAILFGIAFWIADTCVDFFWFGETSASFFKVIVAQCTLHEIYIRSMFTVIFICFAFIFDYTRRRLTLTERQFYAVAEYANDAIISIDRKGVISFWNKKAEEMFGYHYREIIGKSINVIIPEEDQRSFDHNFPFNQLLDRTAELTFVTKDGTSLCVELSLAVWASNGDTLYTAIMRDVTERKRAEQQLKESAAFIKTVMDNLPLGIAVNTVEPYVTFSYMNDNFPKLYHTTREALATPDAFWDAVYEDADYRAKIKERVLADCASGDPKRMLWENVPITRTGKDITYITAQNTPIPNKDLMISLVWDVTAHQRTTEEYLKTQTALTLNAQELARSNIDLERFAFAASHDLQEPLRTIVGYLSLLESRFKAKLPEKAQYYIKQAVGGSKRMQDLIEGLLEYSRVNRYGETVEITNLNEILQEALNSLESTVHKNGTIITHDDLPTLKVDRRQLIRVFQNLVGNAIKFRDKKKEESTVHIGAQYDDDEWIFYVRDNGVGIDNDYLESIFVIFKRLFSLEDYPGTGMGLALCKRIIERHKGRIWVESTPGEGSTFYFTLPCQEGAL